MIKPGDRGVEMSAAMFSVVENTSVKKFIISQLKYADRKEPTTLPCRPSSKKIPLIF